jgi:hypothetical protein
VHRWPRSFGGSVAVQSEILQAFGSSRQRTIETKTGEGEGAGIAGAFYPDDCTGSRGGPDQRAGLRPQRPIRRDIAISILRLTNPDSEIVDRLKRG